MQPFQRLVEYGEAKYEFNAEFSVYGVYGVFEKSRDFTKMLKKILHKSIYASMEGATLVPITKIPDLRVFYPGKLKKNGAHFKKFLKLKDILFRRLGVRCTSSQTLFEPKGFSRLTFYTSIPEVPIPILELCLLLSEFVKNCIHPNYGRFVFSIRRRYPYKCSFDLIYW